MERKRKGRMKGRKNEGFYFVRRHRWIFALELFDIYPTKK